jgi:aminobenzoyl-glutamate utilization protein B
MAKLGYFDGTDVSITWHLWDVSTVTDSTMTALFFAKFHFTGRSAHAGASPEAGRRALDAVELMNVGANYLREHMVAQNRLHFVITNGG